MRARRALRNEMCEMLQAQQGARRGQPGPQAGRLHSSSVFLLKQQDIHSRFPLPEDFKFSTCHREKDQVKHSVVCNRVSKLQPKSDPPIVLINKVLLEHRFDHSLQHIVEGCFPFVTETLWPTKAKISYLALYRKNLLTPGIL